MSPVFAAIRVKKIMDDKVIISIIVPVYNSDRWLESLIADIRRQTYPYYEVILVDDGSKDNSSRICDHAAAKDRRFRVLHTANKGPGAARNEGISAAGGFYIRFLDADDRLGENSLEEMVRPYLGNREIGLVLGRFASDRILWQSTLAGQYSKQDLLRDMTADLYGFYYGAVWNKLYQRELIESCRIRFSESIRWCEDYLFNLTYLRHLKRDVYYVSGDIYHYLTREGSLVSQVDFRQRILIENLCIFRLEEIFEQSGLWSEYAIHAKIEEQKAYVKHSQMCNIGKHKSGFKEFRHWCTRPEDKRFWDCYQNTERCKVYKVIKYLQKRKLDLLLYMFIRGKEILKQEMRIHD